MTFFVELSAVFALRVVQAGVLCLPTLLCGMIAAGVLQAIIGPRHIERWFSRGTRSDFVRAWAFAFFLPVCSIGILPVLWSLRKHGVRWSVVAVVAVAGPFVTPWTLGYLFDRAGILIGLMLIACNAVLALAAGLLIDRMRFTPCAPGMTKLVSTRSTLANVVWAAAASLNWQVMALIAFALLGVGLVAVCIPPNAIGDWLVERGPGSAVTLAVISLFTYVTPEISAMQTGEVLHSSLMPGLAVVMIALGSSVQLGILIGFCFAVGVRRAAFTLSVLLAIACAMSYGLDRFTYDRSFVPEDSHAFEDLGRPFHLLDHPDGPTTGFVERTKRPLGTNAIAAAVGICTLLLVSRSVSKCPPQTKTVWPAQQTVLNAGALYAVATAALTAFTYYPSPAVVAGELRAASADFDVAYRRGEPEVMRRAAQRIDHRLAQFRITSLLHARTPSREQTELASALRADLGNMLAMHDDGETRRGKSIRLQKKLNTFLNAGSRQ